MKNLTSFSVCLAGLMLVVFSLSKIPMYYLAYISQLENSVIAYSLPIVIPCIAGILLFKFPNMFSAAFINIDTSDLDKPSFNEYLQLGLVLIGFVLLFYSISDIVFHISNYLILKNTTDMDMSILNYDYPSFIATIIELLFSLALILKTKNVIVFINKHSAT